MEKDKKIYLVISKWMHDNGAVFKKKHGNWLVLYLKEKQVCIMDTWNGHIYQANDIGKDLIDDGFVDCQLTGRIHTVFSEPVYGSDKIDIKESVGLYQLMLKSS